MKLSDDQLGTLTVLPQTPTALGDVPRRIQITDGTLSLVARGFGKLEKVKLPAGVYQARVESTGKPFEQMVYLPPGREISVTYPVDQRELLSSAAPVPGTEAMHEYMRDPLNKAVMRPASQTEPCRILVMATQPRLVGRPLKKIDFAGFRLLDAGGKERGRMAADVTRAPGNEWSLFSQDVIAGGWVLESPAPNLGPSQCIRQPVWCSRDWSTLIFLGVDSANGMLDIQKASIYLWRIGSSFAPERDPTTHGSWDTDKVWESQRYTEMALRSLINGRSLLSMEEVDTNLLVEKFHNPMLGILGCHLLLQRTARDEKLIRTVLANLNVLVPNHPDVSALEVMARQAGPKSLKDKAPSVSVAWPPMLRQGFTALRDEDWQKPETISSGSLCDRVRTRVVSGGVWTRWIGEKDGKEFITRAAKLGAAPKAISAWRNLSDLTGSLEFTSQNVLSFAKQVLRGRKTLHADDLKWTGMSRGQATAAVRYMKAAALGPAKPGGKKEATRIFLTKVGAKKGWKAKSQKSLQAGALKIFGQEGNKKQQHSR